MAFMNPGGVRADLTFDPSPAGEAPGAVTYGEAFTVQPFGNLLVSMTLTGAQIDTLLEQQWSTEPVAGGVPAPRHLERRHVRVVALGAGRPEDRPGLDHAQRHDDRPGRHATA